VLDLKYIRENLDEVRQNCANRFVTVDLDRLIELDQQRRSLIAAQQELREQRNSLSKQSKGGKPSDAERALGRELKEREAALDAELKAAQANLLAIQSAIPNTTHPEVPIGREEDESRELRRSAEPTVFGFPPLDHVELAERHDLIDFEAGARVAGQKWYFLKNELVLLEQALTRYALGYLRDNGFTLFQTPDVARTEIADGLGFNPRGAETNTYSIKDHGLVLVATAEITLGGMHADQVLDVADLPLRYCGLSHCFRVEAGAAGRVGRGLYRVHQFTKVEMFVFCEPADSPKIHAELCEYEEAIFRALEVPFRVVDVCSGDLGAPAHRKFDLEAWMPGRGEGGSWGEITSTSDCTDYQSRRLGVRYRDPRNNKTRFVHMLNGTAISMCRAMVAIMENHQQADGSIHIPEVLQPFTGFDRIG
jgi:seryl-tRNA synthetase